MLAFSGPMYNIWTKGTVLLVYKQIKLLSITSLFCFVTICNFFGHVIRQSSGLVQILEYLENDEEFRNIKI